MRLGKLINRGMRLECYESLDNPKNVVLRGHIGYNGFKLLWFKRSGLLEKFEIDSEGIFHAEVTRLIMNPYHNDLHVRRLDYHYYQSRSKVIDYLEKTNNVILARLWQQYANNEMTWDNHCENWLSDGEHYYPFDVINVFITDPHQITKVIAELIGGIAPLEK